MLAHLLALTGGPSILLDKPILLLGRDPECDIQLDSPKVSRRHCCIAQVGENLVVRDLASTNGIRINGVRVFEGHLKEGDELTVGNHRFQVRWDAVGIGPSPRVMPAHREGGVEDKPVKDAKPSPAEQGGDELLESADEPVALADPSDGAVDVPRARPLPAKLPDPAISAEGPEHPASAPPKEIVGGHPEILAPVHQPSPPPPASPPA